MNQKISWLVIAICVIVLAVLFQNKQTNLAYKAEVESRTTFALSEHSTLPSDHIYGDVNSPTKIFVYSAANCQYCRAIYPKLKGLVGENYGEVALVYRHLPISFNRGQVSNEEIVSECIANRDGNLGFFTFMESLFGLLPPDEQIAVISDQAIIEAAEFAGFTKEQVVTCLEDASLRITVTAQHELGESLGVTTIPHTYFVSTSTVLNVVGNKPYPALNEILTSVRSKE